MNRRRALTTAARLVCAAALALLCAAASRAQRPASKCDEPMSAPVSFVPLPGRPFSPISSPDGCWLFVSVASPDPKSASGVALLSRRGGRVTLKQVFPLDAAPAGMTITRDGKLLVAAAGASVAFMDTARVGEGAAAVAGSIPAGIFPREFGQSPDRRTLFVANYLSSELEVIDLKRMPVERGAGAPGL